MLVVMRPLLVPFVRLVLPQIERKRVVRMNVVSGSLFVVMMPMRMRVGVIVFLLVFVRVGVVPMFVRMNVELDPFNARLLFARGMDVIFVETELRQFAVQLLERHAQIEQRADEHIAADSAEDIEIKSFHLAGAVWSASVLIWLAA